MEAVVDRVLPQHDKCGAPPISILPAIDCRLQLVCNVGHEENMFSDQQAYRLAAQAFAQMAQIACGQPFERLSPSKQDELLRSVYDENPVAAKDLWALTNIRTVWEMIVSDCACIYQAHLIIQHENGVFDSEEHL